MTERTIIICSRCPLPAPITEQELLARELAWITEGSVTYGICPVCGERVFIQVDAGELDFGVEL